jgi:hypothetical protein
MALIEQPQTREIATSRTAPVVEQTRKTSATRPLARDTALDIVKGLSVIVMVLYHNVEYFPDSPLNLKYLSFVSGAFIFLAGFVVTNIYFQKYDATQSWGLICRRLVVRGLKLIALAVVFNLVIWRFLGSKGGGLGTLYYNLFTGANYRAASFVLVVVIGYSLIATGILVALFQGRSVWLLATAIATVIFSLISNYYHLPHDYYVRLLAIGQLGAALGLVKRATLVKICGQFESVLLLYVTEILLLVVLPTSYWIYLVNLLCTLLLAYSISLKCNETSWLSRKMTLLGQYSLLSYFFQIGFLQCVRRWAGRDIMDEWVVVSIGATTVAMLGFVELTNWMKKKSAVVNQTYKWIFS